MKQKSKRLLLFLSMFFCVVVTSAQERQITGTVKNSDNTPIANASYLIKGTKTGGLTDENGHFTISVKGPNTVLVFSYVNFKTKEVTVGKNSSLDITLEPAENRAYRSCGNGLRYSEAKKILGILYSGSKRLHFSGSKRDESCK